MARKPDTKAATETLAEIEGVFDRMARWVTTNPARFFGGLGLVLGAAALIGGIEAYRDYTELQASEALAEAKAAYFEGMGANLGVTTIPEPANPETARRVRTESIERFLAVADAHVGSRAAVEALLEAGEIQHELGETDTAIETWRQAIQIAPAGTALEGLSISQLARALETRGEWAEAAPLHERAAELEAYPLRQVSLAEAAYAYARTGDDAKARALYGRLREQAPELDLAEHVRARLDELEAEARPDSADG